jgi:hypothetical protein|tara:strand:- start:164 stop:739 length:576 start_codon:yes stop_codon:yes gene_type:complete
MQKSVDQLFEDSAPAKEQNSFLNISEVGMSGVSKLAHAAQRQLKEIDDAEASLKKLKSVYHKNITETLPDLMAEFNLTGFTLSDGSSISVVPTVGAHISKANQEEAFSWLRENGFQDLIKSDVSMSFRKGEDGRRADFIELAESQGHAVSTKESVHPSTLKSFVNEEVVINGRSVPTELFGVFTGQKAIIK